MRRRVSWKGQWGPQMTQIFTALQAVMERETGFDAVRLLGAAASGAAWIYGDLPGSVAGDEAVSGAPALVEIVSGVLR